MARDRAKINTGIWGDADWKSLTMPQQWLYTTLLTRPELNHVGVGDWRPRRISNLTEGTTVQDVEHAAIGLQEQRFILIDEDTEEVLVRSFLKHDGVLDNPNLGASIKGAYDSVYSPMLQQVVIHELRKLADRSPDLPVLKSAKSKKHIEALLELDGTPIDDYLNGVHNGVTDTPTTALGTASTTALQKGDPSTTTTATTTSLSKDSDGGSSDDDRPTKAHPLPKDWAPTKSHFDRAKERGLNIDYEAEQFRLHAEANGRTAKQWNAAFTMWLNKSQQFQQQRTPPQQFQSAAERRYAQGMSLVQDELREFYSQPQEIEQ